jgi:hypothetical protein
MKAFGKFNAAIDWTKEKMHDYCYEVHTEKWQGKDIKEDPKFTMIEILNHSFTCQMVEDLEELVNQIKPNLPWADDHFMERVSGSPLNPPPSHNWWPFAQKNNAEFGGTTKFSHTYPERIWPKLAGKSENDEPHKGVRFNYGDFNDVIDLMVKEPFTRQAFLPIWFPEDTGGANGERVPCTIGYHFIRRHNYLHIVYYIRSCDFFRHFRDDIYLACRKVIWTLERLREKDPESWNDVKPGMYTMHITSLHAFKHEKMLLKKK